MKSVYYRKPRRKFCRFCKDKTEHIDYKDIATLKAFISDKGKIKPRRSTGTCTQHQKRLAAAVKNARELALIPYTSKQ
ncbi:MAG: 30S ribosomal protein S18 [Candidatus Geothermincolia bacterium]